MSTPTAQTGRFSDMVLHTVSSARSAAGGHIFDNERHASLCGIEKRYPRLDHEEDMNGPFSKWLKLNEPWLCRRCLASYRKLTCTATR